MSLMNFYYGVKHSDAEYIFLLGDDDVVSPNFISVILNLLDQNKGIGLIHYNFIVVSPDYKTVKLWNSCFKFEAITNYYNSGRDFIWKYLDSPTFMSSIVFKKECMLNGLQNFYHEDCYGYDWLLCIYYRVLDVPCLYHFMPLVIQRSGEPYQNYARNAIIGLHTIFDYMSKYIPRIDKHWENKADNQGMRFINILLSIIGFKDYYKPFYNEMKRCVGSKSHKRLLYISVFFPCSISKFILFIVKIWLFVSDKLNNRM